ncbi:MAG: class I SAM-dependent methyltransferase [Pirellulales bacterium]|nr:class I SAM-dependent methyltransferase [Pirellulales bacterium]
MLATKQGNLYDYPKYYDLVYGSDWKAEFDFLEACFEKHADLEVRNIYEPACGTGRLLIRFAKADYQVAGVDLNQHAIDYCNDRLQRAGFAPTAVVGDMCDFECEEPVDAAFNTINSFRHLTGEEQARNHLRAVAAALRPGGLYVLGLHLTPTTGQPLTEESWAARRGNLAVLSRMWVTGHDRQRRQERVGMSFDVYTPTEQFRIEDQCAFRTYTAHQLETLLEKVAELEMTAVYDFSYDIDNPVSVGPETEDVIYILKKRVK